MSWTLFGQLVIAWFLASFTGLLAWGMCVNRSSKPPKIKTPDEALKKWKEEKS